MLMFCRLSLVKSRLSLVKKKIAASVSLLVIIVLCLSACISDSKTVYSEYSVADNTELGCVELSHDGITYRPFGNFSNTKLRGTQIGIREGDNSSKIYEVKGYNSSEWIVEYHDVFMGGGGMVFKAVGVTEIPSELEMHRDYDF